MSHVNQDDGIRYADQDEVYHVTGYVTVCIPVDFFTPYEDGSDEYMCDLWDAMGDGCDIGDIEDYDVEIEIVKGEWRD